MKTVVLTLFSPIAFLSILLLACCYFVIAVFLLNYHFLWTTFVGAYPILYKITILFALIRGFPSTMSTASSIILIIDSILVGINFTLLIKTVSLLRGMGGMKISIGGATIISLVTTGCSSCGLSLISVLGLSAGLSFLPFHGLEIEVATMLLLFFSAFSMIAKLMQSGKCKLI